MSDLNTFPFLFKFNPDKVMHHIAYYLYTLSSYKDIRPQRLFVYPSARCNDSCRYCRKKEENYHTDFFENKSYIDKLIANIEEIEIKDIHLFGGGEPFFYKDNMLYFLEKMRKVDTFIRIITNGNNLDDKDLKNIVRDGLISQLNITLNADSDDMASKLYLDKKRHRHTVFILESISKYKKLYNNSFPLIDIMFVLSNVNYNKITNIISILRRFNINYFFIQPLRVDCEDLEELALSKEQVNEFLEMIPRIEESLNDANIKSNINNFKINKNFIEDSKNLKSVIYDKALFGKNRLKLGCYFPLVTFSIYSDGTILKCHFLDDDKKCPEIYNSNYFSISSLKEFIQDGGEYIDFLKIFLGSEDLSLCNNCRICVLYEIEVIRKRFSFFKEKGM